MKCGLSDAYKNDATSNLFLKILMALAFIVEEDILHLYSAIVQHMLPPILINDPRFAEFMEYYEQEWVCSTTRPLSDWNVYHVTDHRTNNMLEGKHSMFLWHFGPHKSLWKFLSLLITLSSREWKKFLIHQNGKPPSRRRRYHVDREREIANLRRMYVDNSITALDYVIKMAHRMAGQCFNDDE